MDNYLYGLNYEDDIEKLYGDNYREINRIRLSLFDNFVCNNIEVRRLRNIIQNPIPITNEQLAEWICDKNNLNNHLSSYDKEILREIEWFVCKYHIKE